MHLRRDVELLLVGARVFGASGHAVPGLAYAFSARALAARWIWEGRCNAATLQTPKVSVLGCAPPLAWGQDEPHKTLQAPTALFLGGRAPLLARAPMDGGGGGAPAGGARQPGVHAIRAVKVPLAHLPRARSWREKRATMVCALGPPGRTSVPSKYPLRTCLAWNTLPYTKELAQDMRDHDLRPTRPYAPCRAANMPHRMRSCQILWPQEPGLPMCMPCTTRGAACLVFVTAKSKR